MVSNCIIRIASSKMLDDDIYEDEIRCFISHRHDQSIFSLLDKKYSSVKIRDETFERPKVHYFRSGRH